jgi:hypothetical protein
VIAGCNGTAAVSSDSIRHRRASVASTRIPSIHANGSPMQTRVPPPKGKYANLGRPCCRWGSQRSGSKRSGFGKNRASRCRRYWENSTTVPLGIVYPPISKSSIARLPIAHAGGYSRIDSASNMRAYGSRGTSAAAA